MPSLGFISPQFISRLHYKSRHSLASMQSTPNLGFKSREPISIQPSTSFHVTPLLGSSTNHLIPLLGFTACHNTARLQHNAGHSSPPIHSATSHFSASVHNMPTHFSASQHSTSFLGFSASQSNPRLQHKPRQPSATTL
jgi:hypothetical protein